MNKIISFIKTIGEYATAAFPTRMPIGVTEFNAWADSVVRLSGLPDNDSMRFALASIVIRLGPTEAYKSKVYFILSLRAGAAKQVAGYVFTELKEKQRAAEAAAAATVNTAAPNATQ